MWFVIFFICTGFGVYVFYELTKNKRAEKKLNYVRKKFVMSKDFVYCIMADTITEKISDLNGQFVETLREGGEFWLTFIGGSVYCERRWGGKIGDTVQMEKEIECVLNRIDWGRKPLNGENNRILAEMVLYDLSRHKWLTITKKKKLTTIELHISPNSNFVIPQLSLKA